MRPTDEAIVISNSQDVPRISEAAEKIQRHQEYSQKKVPTPEWLKIPSSTTKTILVR